MYLSRSALCLSPSPRTPSSCLAASRSSCRNGGGRGERSTVAGGGVPCTRKLTREIPFIPRRGTSSSQDNQAIVGFRRRNVLPSTMSSFFRSSSRSSFTTSAIESSWTARYDVRWRGAVELPPRRGRCEGIIVFSRGQDHSNVQTTTTQHHDDNLSTMTYTTTSPRTPPRATPSSLSQPTTAAPLPPPPLPPPPPPTPLPPPRHHNQ